jgi:hypothetical protein
MLRGKEKLHHSLYFIFVVVSAENNFHVFTIPVLN